MTQDGALGRLAGKPILVVEDVCFIAADLAASRALRFDTGTGCWGEPSIVVGTHGERRSLPSRWDLMSEQPR